MAGTRTAEETLAANISENQISIGLVDASGDTYSENYSVTGAALPSLVLVEAVVAAYQLATQASIWEVRVTNVWQGSKNPTNANALYRGTKAEGINMLYRDTDVLNAVQTQRLVAPVAATMVSNTDTPVYPLIAPMVALNDAQIALIGAGYSLESIQFTGRRERRNNTRIST